MKRLEHAINAPTATGSAPQAAAGEKELWEFYRVKLRCRDRLVGGYPKNPDSVAAMLRARGLEDLIPPAPDPAIMTEEEKAAAKQSAVEKSATGFRSDARGHYIESRQIKAMLKECANILKGPQILDVKNYKSKVAERVFVVEPAIYFAGEPDGTDSRVVHVMTAMGPRSSIKFYDYYVGPAIEFHLRVLRDGVVTADRLRTMLEYAQENGLGADRSQGFGQFDLLEFELVAFNPALRPLGETVSAQAAA